MKRRLVQLLATVLVLIAVWVGFRQMYFARLNRAGSSPRVHLPQVTWDGGEVMAGSELLASFPITNRGSRRLIVQVQSGDCACMSAERSSLRIEPGETKNLEVNLKTNDREVDLKSELTCTTNDPCRPRFVLTTTAHVVTSSPAGSGTIASTRLPVSVLTKSLP